VIAGVLCSFASECSDNWPKLMLLVEFAINNSALSRSGLAGWQVSLSAKLWWALTASLKIQAKIWGRPS
jgi:hypothetical protein